MIDYHFDAAATPATSIAMILRSLTFDFLTPRRRHAAFDISRRQCRLRLRRASHIDISPDIR